MSVIVAFLNNTNITDYEHSASWPKETGLEKMALHLDIFSMQFFYYVGWPPSGAEKWKNLVSHSRLLIKLGPICNSLVTTFGF